ncbi:unnamed protein product [Oncorhynchus mykiss]|uniref:Adenosine 3'-phospho 5'-phosphosulfate transporter 2 n=1 Tax=Oncorhynchus mykiss TaxID=8022 RepID=A0A060Y0I1_ONCMY|nr:unnamed protein product [Oncorhynchus mykiss]
MSDKFGPMNYNNARKHLSISIPSSSEVMMSPHIKSVEELRVLGINLSSFNTATQFGICTAGIFFFHLLYGYLQELIFSMEGFKPFGWYPCTVWVLLPVWTGGIAAHTGQTEKNTREDVHDYSISNGGDHGPVKHLGYMNYPTRVIFKCCKLIPVMIGGVFIQGRSCK